MNEDIAYDIGVDEADQNVCPEDVRHVDVLAEDLKAWYAWLSLKEYAEANPGEVVLCSVGWRPAVSEQRIISHAVRAALLARISQRAVSNLGNYAMFEKIGKWPSGPRPCDRVSSTLGNAVRKVLELIEWFSVEDEDSFQALMRACRKELPDVTTKVGAIACDTLEAYLRDAKADARKVLARLNEDLH